MTIAYLLLLLAWGLISYSTFGVFLYQGTMFARKVNGTLAFTDFVNTYNAALLSKESLKSKQNIYDPLVQARSQEPITAPLKPDKPFYLQYPPYFFALMLPLSLFNVGQAWCIWSLLATLSIIASVKYLAKDIRRDKLETLLLYTSIFTAYPVWLSFGMGQPGLLNFAAIVAFWALLDYRRYFQAGLAAAIVAIKLQYAVIIGMIGLIVGQTPFLGGLALLMTLMLLYTAAVLGTDNILAFPTALLTYETSHSVSGVSPVTMQNIRGYLTLIFPQQTKSINTICAFIFLAATAGIALIWRRWTKEQTDRTSENRRQLKYLISLTMPLILITSLHTHVYDYMLMTIPCIWLWDLTNSPASPGSYRTISALRFLIISFPVTSWIFAKTRTALSTVYIHPEIIWAAAILMLGACLYFREYAPTDGSKALKNVDV